LSDEETGKLRELDCGGESHGLIFNIQKFSLHDGSGIRTLVFLKGCPLGCRWCSNPEGRAHLEELAYNLDKCIGVAECGECIPRCELGAIERREDGRVEVKRERCNHCGLCVEACPSMALELFGKPMSIEDVLEVVEEDSRFYARSGGGLTLSGGEPLLQARFARDLLEAAQRRGIDTALETSGHGRWDDLEHLCRHVDQVFYDVKCMDPEKHKREVGVGNKLILENLRRLCEQFKGLHIAVRTPVIPGFNDSPGEIEAIASFVADLPGSCQYELLPYHGFGEPKYRHLGLEYPLRDLSPPTEEQMARLRKIVGAQRDPIHRSA
jgi:pyruvate formate lyase activating enzyme